MKDISGDPLSSDDGASSSSISSPSVSDSSLLAMRDLVLDRSDDTPAVSDLSFDPAPPQSDEAIKSPKRRTSFRELLLKPLRGRRSVSSSPDDRSAYQLKKVKKKKDKSSGCAGWLDKKRKRRNSIGELPSSGSGAESSNGSSDRPMPLPQITRNNSSQEDDDSILPVAKSSLQCSRCCRIDGPSGDAQGVTYTKRPAGVDANDESWMCSDCLQSWRRHSSSESTSDTDSNDWGVPFYRIAPLAHLALNILIADVSKHIKRIYIYMEHLNNTINRLFMYTV